MLLGFVAKVSLAKAASSSTMSRASETLQKSNQTLVIIRSSAFLRK